jgi:surface antigen Omp85-like protein
VPSLFAVAVLVSSLSATAPSSEPRTEFGLVPLAGGNTDLGVAAGVMGSIARLSPDRAPYVWRTEFVAIASVKSQDDRLTMPYQDYYVLFTMPDLIPNVLRAALRASFTRSQLSGYYGLGNASADATRIAGMSSRYDQYDRIYPSIRLDARARIEGDLYLRLMPSYTHNWVNIYQNSQLMADRDVVRAPHQLGVPMMHVGVVWDSRDDEIATSSGEQHELSIRAAPLTFGDGSSGYGGANFTGRWFVPIIRRTLVLASRFVADTLFGAPPVFELSQVEEQSSLGGEYGVRGVPAQRFSGETKLYGNVELRAQLLPFRAFDQEFVLGTVAFLDAGRVFAKRMPMSGLDGSALGVHWGTGGGFRLRWGEAFVIRADVAWSPDANPIGAYLNAGQVF